MTIPAAAQLAGGKQVNDFTAYVGEDNGRSQGLMSNFSADGKYSSLSYNRYMSSASGVNAVPYILIGYPELCFNIAEGAFRGWVTGVSASDWYLKGINASMNVYGMTQGQVVTIGNVDGTKPNQGTATIDINTFLADPHVAWDNSNGLTELLTQKYVAFFMNSGFESYYNWRRTGIPTFSEGGVGIGTPSNKIPLRWQYPQDEINYNSDHYKASIGTQFRGTEDVNAKMWLIKYTAVFYIGVAGKIFRSPLFVGAKTFLHRFHISLNARPFINRDRYFIKLYLLFERKQQDHIKRAVSLFCNGVNVEDEREKFLLLMMVLQTCFQESFSGQLPPEQYARCVFVLCHEYRGTFDQLCERFVNTFVVRNALNDGVSYSLVCNRDFKETLSWLENVLTAILHKLIRFNHIRQEVLIDTLETRFVMISKTWVLH